MTVGSGHCGQICIVNMAITAIVCLLHLQEVLVSVVQHVCGNHEWAGGWCAHSDDLDDRDAEGG